VVFKTELPQSVQVRPAPLTLILHHLGPSTSRLTAIETGANCGVLEQPTDPAKGRTWKVTGGPVYAVSDLTSSGTAFSSTHETVWAELGADARA
jgi:hypothetical protein